MSLGTMDGATAQRFHELCSAISSRGRGITLPQLGDCAALARELAKEDPDPARVRDFRKRLGLEDPNPAAVQKELEL